MEIHTHASPVFGMQACKGAIHVYQEKVFGGAPFCACGRMRNPAYKRTLWHKLTGKPKYEGNNDSQN